MRQSLCPPHHTIMSHEHVSDHDLERYYLGMLTDEENSHNWRSISLVVKRASNEQTKLRTMWTRYGRRPGRLRSEPGHMGRWGGGQRRCRRGPVNNISMPPANSQPVPAPGVMDTVPEIVQRVWISGSGSV